MLDWENRNSLWHVRSHDLTNEKNFCVCISCSCSAFPCFQGEVKEVQDSVSKSTLPVNISVLSNTWQQFECHVDVCYVNGNTQCEYLLLFFFGKTDVFDVLLFANCIHSVSS